MDLHFILHKELLVTTIAFASDQRALYAAFAFAFASNG